MAENNQEKPKPSQGTTTDKHREEQGSLKPSKPTKLPVVPPPPPPPGPKKTMIDE